MKSIEITGASDDLIEVDGAIAEEFSPAYNADGAWLAFPNGALLRIRYSDEGIWRITTPLGARPDVTVEPCSDPTGETTYTDRATVELDDDVTPWVLFAEQQADGARVLARQ